ncbi:MAG: tetratricopeptide repeat protein [Candidatus Zhuqueibacterota bacterium]
MIIETIGLFVAKELASYAISKKLDKIFTKPKTFEKRLARVIDAAIDEYQARSPIAESDGKYPFYQSRVFLEALLKIRLFGADAHDVDVPRLQETLRWHDKILRPTEKQLTDFLAIFEARRLADAELKKLALEENYREQIFRNTDKLDAILNILSRFHPGPAAIPKELTRVPRMPRQDIVGREADLAALRTALLNHQQTVLVNGMGGIGKTTLAMVYVDAFYGDYDHIAWLTVETDLEQAIAANYELLTNLRLLDIPPEHQFSACLNALRTLQSRRPLLLVLDNAAPNLARHFDALPKAPGCHVLATSRNAIAPFHTIPLDFLPEDEACRLFTRHAHRFSDADVRAIVKRVEYHTLTIEILARSAQKFRWSYDRVMDALPQDARTDIETRHSQYQKIERVKSYLVSICNLAGCSPQELHLLKQFLFLPNEWLDYGTLVKLAQADKLDWRDEFAATAVNLHERGLVQYDAAQDSYKMHPVLAEALAPQVTVAWDDIASLCESVSGLLAIDRTKDNPVEKFQYIPPGRAIVDRAGERFPNELAKLKNNLALVYKELGDYGRARDLLEAALAANIKHFGQGHPTVAKCQSNLALVCKDLGEYGRARDLLEAALAADLKHFGEDHPTVATRQSNLALVCQDLGDYGQARDLLEAALAADIKHFGDGHPNVAIDQSILAAVCQDLGEYERARDLLEAALAADIKHFGKEHPTVATHQSNLALVCQDLGDYGRARDLLEAALAANIKHFGEGHPNVATSQSNLALVCKDLGEYERARDLLEAALAADIKHFGEGHPTVAVDQSNLATVYKDLGNAERARDLLEAALAANIKHFGEGHPNVATSQSNLALVCKDLGEYERARDLLEAALDAAIKHFGEGHPTVAVDQSNLATVYKDLGNAERARDLLEAALDAAIKHFGEGHPTVATRQSNLALVCKDLGEYERARDLLEAALAADIKHFGEGHPTVAIAQSNLALVYQALGEYERARDLLEAALDAAIKHFGEGHPTVATRQSNLALVCQDLGDYERARDLLEAALDAAIKHFGEGHPTVAVDQSNLATVYRDLGDAERAVSLWRQAHATLLARLGEGHPYTKTVAAFLEDYK